ncbi:MAG: trimeric intracellular cation channel family protein [Actinomycetaceae bacterium]|nr:trimeric intracellular cation channel family protein [Actinomycetaceae bacterium]
MLLTVLFVIGITAEAMTAALAAGRERMDLFGVIMLAEVTALGGGTVRDVVLGHYPLTWVKTPEYLIVVAVAALLTVFASKLMAYFRMIFLTADAVGLAVFTVVGINVALEMGYGFIIALVAATITGVFGGILRDVFSNRVPLVFRKELYAAVVLIGVIGYWIMRYFDVPRDVNTIVTLLIVFIVRMLAVKFEWSLPVFVYQEHNYERSDVTKLWRSGSWFSDLRPVRKLRKRRKKKNDTESTGDAGDDNDAGTGDAGTGDAGDAD